MASNYELYNSIILNLETSLYVFNNRAKFISDIKPILERVCIGLHIEEIIGYSIAVVTVNNPKGKRQIQLLGAAFILDFYTNLVYLNNKGVY